MPFIVTLILWVLINIADEWSSQATVKYPGLIETDPLSRDPKTKKYSLRRGILGKIIALGLVMMFHFEWGQYHAAVILMAIHAVAVVWAVKTNLSLISQAKAK